jgi:hypothetical protein
MPQTNPILTTSETPVFFWYVPPTKSQPTGELALLDEHEKTLYSATFKLENRAGIVGLKLPRAVAQLMTIGETYKLQFSQICPTPNPDEPAVINFVESWVQRVNPSPTLTQALKGAQPRQQATIYAANGLWENALTRLIELRLKQPGDQFVLKDWKELLESVALGEFTQQPLLSCCQQTGEISP